MYTLNLQSNSQFPQYRTLINSPESISLLSNTKYHEFSLNYNKLVDNFDTLNQRTTRLKTLPQNPSVLSPILPTLGSVLEPPSYTPSCLLLKPFPLVLDRPRGLSRLYSVSAVASKLFLWL